MPDEAHLVDGLAIEKMAKRPPNQSSGTKKQAPVLDTVHDLLLAIDRCHLDINLKGLLTGAGSIACGTAYRKCSGWQIVVV